MVMLGVKSSGEGKPGALASQDKEYYISLYWEDPVVGNTITGVNTELGFVG